jgi:hypothetical protein
MSNLQPFPTLDQSAEIGDVITTVNQLARIRQNDIANQTNQNAYINNIVIGPTQTVVAGHTTGTITYSQPAATAGYKLIMAYFSGYENDTTVSQTITYPTPFSVVPFIAQNATTLSITASTASFTINTPDSTATSTGLLILQGY